MYAGEGRNVPWPLSYDLQDRRIAGHSERSSVPRARDLISPEPSLADKGDVTQFELSNALDLGDRIDLSVGAPPQRLHERRFLFRPGPSPERVQPLGKEVGQLVQMPGV